MAINPRPVIRVLIYRYCDLLHNLTVYVRHPGVKNRGRRRPARSRLRLVWRAPLRPQRRPPRSQSIEVARTLQKHVDSQNRWFLTAQSGVATVQRLACISNTMAPSVRKTHTLFGCGPTAGPCVVRRQLWVRFHAPVGGVGVQSSPRSRGTGGDTSAINEVLHQLRLQSFLTALCHSRRSQHPDTNPQLHTTGNGVTRGPSR